MRIGSTIGRDRRPLMRRWMAVMVAVAGLLALAQLVPVTEDNPPAQGDFTAPPAVTAIVRRACYDCHSSENQWPWYGRIAPLSWIVSRHVNQARRRLNFSDWTAYTAEPERETHKLRAIGRLVGLGLMPPWYHRVTHPDERLSAADSAELLAWVKAEEGRAKAAMR